MQTQADIGANHLNERNVYNLYVRRLHACIYAHTFAMCLIAASETSNQEQRFAMHIILLAVKTDNLILAQVKFTATACELLQAVEKI